MRMTSTKRLENQLLHYELKELHNGAEDIFEIDIKPWLKKVFEDCMVTELEERKIGVEE